MTNAIVVASAAMFVVACFVSVRRTNNLLHPVALAALLFGVNCLFTVLDVFRPTDQFTSAIGEDAAWLVLLLSLVFVFCSCHLRHVASEDLSYVGSGVNPPLWLPFVAVVCGVLLFAALFVKAGGQIPMLAMANLTANKLGAERLEFEIPFLGEFVLGLYRALLIYLCVYIVSEWRSGSIIPVSIRAAAYAVVILSVIFVLNGKRNPLFWAVYMPLLAVGMSRGISIVRVLTAGVSLMVLFTLLGNIRRAGRDFEEGLTQVTGLRFIDSALSWFAAYFAPNFRNLDRVVNLIDERHYGVFYLSKTIPDFLIGPFATPPPDVIQVMIEMQGFDYGSLTFITILGDLFYDFGWGGSLVAVAIILWVYVMCYNSSGRSLVMMALTFNFSVSLILMFAVNRFMGMGQLLGVLVFLALEGGRLASSKNRHITR
jgi:oligosaccharide repeat unit polymerase